MHLGHIADAIERNLDVRRSGRGRRGAAFFTRALGCAERAARAACKRVALTERVEDLASHASRRVRAEGGPAIAAIPVGSLDETEHARRNEVLAVRTATARIKCARGDGSRETEVRKDAFLASGRVCAHATRTRLRGNVVPAVCEEVTR